MINGIRRFRPAHPLRPYVGLGVGATEVDYDVTTRGAPYLLDNATAPVVQLLLGFEIALTERLDFTTDYRIWYSSWLEVETVAGHEADMTHWVHSFNFGLRYSL